MVGRTGKSGGKENCSQVIIYKRRINTCKNKKVKSGVQRVKSVCTEASLIIFFLERLSLKLMNSFPFFNFGFFIICFLTGCFVLLGCFCFYIPMHVPQQ